MIIEIHGKYYQFSKDELARLDKFINQKNRLSGFGKEPFSFSELDSPPSPSRIKKISEMKREPKNPIISPVLCQMPEWDEWTKKALRGNHLNQETVKALTCVLGEIYYQAGTSRYLMHVVDKIIINHPSLYEGIFFSHDIPGDDDDAHADIEIPDILVPLAEINTISGQGSRATELGKGEMVIPFLFKDAKWQGSNATHDVMIGGFGWHIKEVPRLSSSARMGVRSYAGSRVQSFLDSLGFSATDLSGGAKGSQETSLALNIDRVLSQMIQQPDDHWASMPQGSTFRDASEKIQDALDEDMREKAIGQNSGICLYVPSEKMLYFRGRNLIYCGNVSQAAHYATTSPEFFVRNVFAYLGSGKAADVVT